MLPNDGYLGLASDLGSGTQSYIQYLKQMGAISQNAFSLDFDYDNFLETQNYRADLIFGKYDTPKHQSTIEVKNLLNNNMHLISSKGFSFFNEYFDYTNRSDLLLIYVDPHE